MSDEKRELRRKVLDLRFENESLRNELKRAYYREAVLQAQLRYRSFVSDLGNELEVDHERK